MVIVALHSVAVLFMAQANSHNVNIMKSSGHFQ